MFGRSVKIKILEVVRDKEVQQLMMKLQTETSKLIREAMEARRPAQMFGLFGY